MSIDKEMRKTRQKIYMTARDRQKEHKCSSCLWARWSDVESATCAFGRCFREVTAQKYTKK